MSADKDLNAEVAKMSYEQARDELINVVAELEQGSVSLEASRCGSAARP
jgi:exonuclease VII small subunit